VFDVELNRIAEQVGSREKAFKLVETQRFCGRLYDEHKTMVGSSVAGRCTE
jgi:hypothetical protein